MILYERTSTEHIFFRVVLLGSVKANKDSDRSVSSILAHPGGSVCDLVPIYGGIWS
jgi:hypothetical protein